MGTFIQNEDLNESQTKKIQIDKSSEQRQKQQPKGVAGERGVGK